MIYLILSGLGVVVSLNPAIYFWATHALNIMAFGHPAIAASPVIANPI